MSGSPRQANFAVFGLSAYSGAWHGPVVHSHPELELHVISDRSRSMDYAGRESRIVAGRIYAFWGIRPHRTHESKKRLAHHHVIRIPIALFWRWDLPADFVRALLSQPPNDLQAERWGIQAIPWMGHMVELVNDSNPLCQRAAEAHLQAFFFEAAIRHVSKPPGRHAPLFSAPLARRLESVVIALSDPSNRRPSIEAAAAQAGLHRVTAGKVFRQMTGLSLREFVMSLRVQHAAWLLHHTPHSIGEIADLCGFSSVPRFHAAFVKRIETTPGKFRELRQASETG